MKISREQLKTPEAAAVIAAFLYGIFTHFFALSNILHNHDNIASQPGGFGGGVSLGRWLLEILGQAVDKVGLNYNLSVINGVLFICLIAVSAGFLVSVLHIKSRKSSALIGMLFVAFPTATATLVYRYTAVFYGLGVLFAVLAVWVLQRCRYGFVLSVLLITASLGIYQAYIPLTIGLFVLLLLQQALQGDAEIGKLIRTGLVDCGALILGLMLYFLGVKASEAIFGGTLTDYQGVGSMGNISLGQLPSLIWQAFSTVCALPMRDFCGIANRAMMRLGYLALGILSIAMVGYILIVKVRKLTVAVAAGVLCLIFPVAVSFIIIMCPDGWVYTLMVYSFILLACAPLVLYECLPPMDGVWKQGKRVLAGGLGLVTAMLVFYYGYYANVNYTALHYANRQIENYLNSVVVQVRMTEGFTPDKQWAIMGEIEDPLFGSPWEEDTVYGGLGFTQYLLNQYSRNDWIENYIGYNVPQVSEEMLAQLSGMEEVRNMPCWPSEGSIKVIGETVVIKFQDLNA